MADAFCGPSNALQNFSKHTTVDRTLQQDRTQHRSLPGLFRSVPASQFRNPDAEVNAFQASSAIPAFAPQLPSLNHEFSSRRPFQPLQQAQQIPSWATDFQNMSMADTYRPLSASQIRQVAPPQQGSQGWRQDFASRASHIVPQSTSHYAQAPSYQGQNYGMQDYYPSMMEQPFYAQEPMHQPMAHQQEQSAAPIEMFDDAAFASAFENASLELQQTTTKGKEIERHADNAEEQISFDLSHASVEPPDHTGTFDMDSFMDNMRSISDIAASQSQEQEEEQESQQPSSTLSNFVEAMKQIAEIAQTQQTASDEEDLQEDTVMGEDQDVFEDAQQDLGESSTTAPVINQQGQVNLDSFTKLMTDLAQLAEAQGVQNYEDIQLPPIVNSEGNVNLNSFTNLMSDLASMAQQQGVENLEDLQLSGASGMVLEQALDQEAQASAEELQRDLEAENASLDRVATPVAASRTTELPSWWNDFQIGDDLNEDYMVPPVQDPAPLATAEEVRQEEPKSEEAQAQEANELAATAGELLERLRDEHDDKFLNSSFMSLMRQFRDHEVRVEGDKLVENPQPAHPGGQYYPHDAFVGAGTSNFKDWEKTLPLSLKTYCKIERFITMAKPKCLLLGSVDFGAAQEEYKKLGELAELVETKATGRDEFLDECKKGTFDGVKVIYRTFPSAKVTGRFDEEVIKALPNTLKFVCHCGAGYDNIDIEPCTARGIHVSNVPTAVDDATADTAVFLILGALRNFNGSMMALRRGEWRGNPPQPFAHDPEGKVLGILGYGGIGRNLARKMKAFGMRVQYYSRNRLDEKEEDGANYVSFEELLKTSDVLSLNLPLNANTRHIIGKKELSLMKTTAVLVNTARGGVIDEAALVEALDKDEIASVGLDVFEEEPKIHPGLMKNEKVTLLPHMGTWTFETQTAMELWNISNVRMSLETGRLRSPVPEQKSMSYDA